MKTKEELAVDSAPKYTGETCSSTRRSAYIDGFVKGYQAGAESRQQECPNCKTWMIDEDVLRKYRDENITPLEAKLKIAVEALEHIAKLDYDTEEAFIDMAQQTLDSIGASDE